MLGSLFSYGGDEYEYDVMGEALPVVQDAANEFDTISSTLEVEIAKLSAQNQQQTEMTTEMMERIAKLEEQVNKGACDKFKEGLQDFGKKLKELGQAIKNSALVQWAYEGLCQIGCKIERAVASVQEKVAEWSRGKEMASLDKAFEKAGNAIDKVANKRDLDLGSDAHNGLGSDLAAAKAELEARHEEQRRAAQEKLTEINKKHNAHKTARQEHGTKMQVAVKEAVKAKAGSFVEKVQNARSSGQNQSQGRGT
jgi:vacuolar-type H+-ATPase subunit E/Vma4